MSDSNLTRATKGLAETVGTILEKYFGRNQIGFILITTHLGTGGQVSFQSDLDRTSTIKVLRELLREMDKQRRVPLH